MKKTVIAFLLLMLLNNSTKAQRKRYAFLIPPAQVSRTDAVFSRMGLTHRVQLMVRNRTTIDIRLLKMKHLNAIQNLDSLLNRVWETVSPLKDSFPNDLNNRLLNVNLSPNGQTRIRLITYPPRGDSYATTNEGLVRMKVEQDTLIITGFIPEETKNVRPNEIIMGGQEPVSGKASIVNAPWQIIITINNLSELPTLTGSLQSYVNDVAAHYVQLTGHNPEKNFLKPVNLIFEPLSNFTGLDKYIVYRTWRKGYAFEVITQFGIQNLRSGLGANAGLGVGFSSIFLNRSGKSFFLVWEPYFFFEKTAAGEWRKLVNHFVSVQYKVQFANPTNSPDAHISNNLSLGYLVHREGDYFNKNTFKLGLPGMEFRNLLIHPQLIFNDFFKQAYPSIRLKLDLH